MKVMNLRNRIVMAFLAILSPLVLMAQNSQVLYFMNLPQARMANPATRPSSSVYIGLPAVSGLNININNNFFNFSDVFVKKAGSDSVYTFLHPDFDADDFLSAVSDKNFIEPQFSVQLLGIGFKAGSSGYFFLDVNERAEANIVIPGDLLRLALKGNEQFAGSSLNLSTLRGDIKYYREAGLGYSVDINERLRVGVKAKFLMGMAAASVVNNSLALRIGDDYSHTIDADLKVNISAPVKIEKDEDGDISSVEFDDTVFDETDKAVAYATGFDNPGFSFDLGATYKFSDRLTFSAAITDLGFIKWKRDVTNLMAESSFEFSGFDLTDVIDETRTFDEVADEMLDSLANSFVISDTKKAFSTSLPLGISAGASWNLTKSFNVGLLSYTRIIGEQIRQSLTVSGNLNVGNALMATLAYTAANNRYDNLGAGFSLRAGIFQFYMLADRIPLTWNKIISDGSAFPVPESWNTLNLRFGMNFVFGNRVKTKHDNPIIEVE